MRTVTFKNNTWRLNLAIVTLLALAAIALVLAESGVAFAHAHLKTATILPDSTLTSVPTVLTLTFTEETSPTETKLSVTDSTGKVVDKGDLKVDGANATIGINITTAGTYTVTYRSFTEDDSGIINGSYTFMVAKSGAGAEGSVSKATETESGGDEAPAAPATGVGALSEDSGSFTIPALLVLGSLATFAGAMFLIRQKRRA